jgi:hypothetical protein
MNLTLYEINRRLRNRIPTIQLYINGIEYILRPISHYTRYGIESDAYSDDEIFDEDQIEEHLTLKVINPMNAYHRNLVEHIKIYLTMQEACSNDRRFRLIVWQVLQHALPIQVDLQWSPIDDDSTSESLYQPFGFISNFQ